MCPQAWAQFSFPCHRCRSAISWRAAGWRYLVEGQAVLGVGPVPPQLRAAERSARRRQLLDDLHGAGGEHAAEPVDLPQVPVLVQLAQQHDDVPLVEPQLPGAVPAVRVQRLGSRDLWDQKQPLHLSLSAVLNIDRISQKHS